VNKTRKLIMPLFNLAPPNVQKLKDKRDVTGLIKALHYEPKRSEDCDIPALAASALGEIGDAQAVDALIAFSEGGASRKEIVLEALRHTHNMDSAKPLVAALGHELPYIRQAAAEALGRLGNADRAIVRALLIPLMEGNQEVRAAAMQALYCLYCVDVEKKVTYPNATSEMRSLPKAKHIKEETFAQELLSFAAEQKDFVDAALDSLFWVPTNEEGRKDILQRMLAFGEHAVKPMARSLGNFGTCGTGGGAQQTFSFYARQMLRDMYDQSTPEIRSKIVDELIEAVYEWRNKTPSELHWFLAELGDTRATKALIAAQNYMGYPDSRDRDPLFQLRGEIIFQFRSGQPARIPQELGLLCEQAPEDGMYHFLDGHFDGWLTDIGRPDLAERCRKLRSEGGDPGQSLKRFAVYCDARESRYKLVKSDMACSVCGRIKITKTRYWDKGSLIQWVGRCPECHAALCIEHALFDQELGDYVCPHHRLRIRLHDLES